MDTSFGDTLDSLFDLHPGTDVYQDQPPRRDRLNAFVDHCPPTPRQSTVSDIHCRYRPPYGYIAGFVTSLSLVVFGMVMLTRAEVCYGCSFTSLITGVFFFWVGYLVALNVSN